MSRRLVVSCCIAVLALSACGGDQRGPSRRDRNSTTTAPTVAATTTTSPGRPMRVLVVGDSTARIVGDELQRVGGLFGIEVRNEAHDGCGILPDAPVRYGVVTTLDPVCTAWRERFQAALDEFDPDRVIVLNGFWDAYDWQLDGQALPFGATAWDAFAGASFGEAMDLLSSRGALVYWLDAPYYAPYFIDPDVRQYAAEHGSYDSAYDDDRVRHLNDLYQELVAGRTGDVVSLDLRTVVCPDDQYVGVVGGSEIRGDGVHFTDAGTALIVEWLANEIREHEPGLEGGSCPATTQPTG